MAFGSDSFPLGPNGQFPRQRIRNAGNEIAPPEMMEELYDRGDVARLPVVERDFHSSVNRAKERMQRGKMMRREQGYDDLRPRYALKGKLGRPIRTSITELITPIEKGRRLGVRAFSGSLSGEEDEDDNGLGRGFKFKKFKKIFKLAMLPHGMLMKVAKKLPGGKQLMRLTNRIPGGRLLTDPSQFRVSQLTKPMGRIGKEFKKIIPIRGGKKSGQAQEDPRYARYDWYDQVNRQNN